MFTVKSGHRQAVKTCRTAPICSRRKNQKFWDHSSTGLQKHVWCRLPTCLASLGVSSEPGPCWGDWVTSQVKTCKEAVLCLGHTSALRGAALSHVLGPSLSQEQEGGSSEHRAAETCPFSQAHAGDPRASGDSNAVLVGLSTDRCPSPAGPPGLPM